MRLVKLIFALFFLAFANNQVFAQYDVPLYASYTTVKARARMMEQVHKNTITANLSLPLNDSTEENWMDAFSAMEVFNIKTQLTQAKTESVFAQFTQRSTDFQRAFLEMIYTLYPGQYTSNVVSLLDSTSHTKIFAMMAEYVLQSKNPDFNTLITEKINSRFGDLIFSDSILVPLLAQLQPASTTFTKKELLEAVFSKSFLPGQTIMYSFQRQNRDYPGLVLIRNANGIFIKDSTGQFFNIPQLARSITNLPYYLTNGNTPQGLFRMFGFSISMSNFIGPTANVQMGMPFEIKKRKYLGDSSIRDSIFMLADYKKLLPKSLENYFPIYGAYYAGRAGRTEIIAHGTTVDPSLYTSQKYYPLTPTQGCLCTYETWNGARLESDQQKLINGLLKAGGAYGYVLVLEIDNKEEAVTLNDLLPYL